VAPQTNAEDAGSGPGEVPQSGRHGGRVLDPSALRALAHPLRFQLVELLVEHGPSTASELGRRVGESSGSTSYHLRQLAKEGLIEEAPELGNARDRWWRVVKGGWSLEGFDVLEQEETRDDAQMVLDELLRARFQRLRRWHRDASRWGEPWMHSTVEMTGRFRLTREELAALTEELVAVVDRYRDLQADRHGPDAPVTDAVPVNVQLDVFPTGDPPSADPTNGSAAERASGGAEGSADRSADPS
jgi:DNA-binding transcriptional ArsR family regulator